MLTIGIKFIRLWVPYISMLFCLLLRTENIRIKGTHFILFDVKTHTKCKYFALKGVIFGGI